MQLHKEPHGRLLDTLMCLGAIFVLFVLETNPSVKAYSAELTKARMSKLSRVLELQKSIVREAQSLMNNHAISYTYGGASVQDDKHCKSCTLCLEDKKPKPKQRLKSCHICAKCSLDCSHFVHLVFEKSGLGFAYLTSVDMLKLSPQRLKQGFGLLDIPLDQGFNSGDLLVYRGHVAILERALGRGHGDIIHATGGKEIRRPGQGIQRERNVNLARFRGPLLRTLRHSHLTGQGTASISKGEGRPSPSSRLRPVPQRGPLKSN